MYSLGIEVLNKLVRIFKYKGLAFYFSNNLRRFGVVNRFQILLHSIVVFSLLI